MTNTRSVNFGSDFIASLKEFYSEQEIRGFWKEALDAAAARSRATIHINSRTRDGNSSAGIVLATPAEYMAFIRACRVAIAELKGEDVGQIEAGSASTKFINFSQRPVGT